MKRFASGATGYVVKHSAGDELIAAVHASLEGRTYLTPLLAQEVQQLLLVSAGGSDQQFAKCTCNDVKTPELIVEGEC